MLKFNRTYFAFTILILLIEISIALFVHDRFIRPYFGDFLVVILLYCLLKSFLNISVWTATIIVLCFSFFVEITQYFNLIVKLGLENSGTAKAILGNSFAWFDLVAYFVGIVCVIVIEKVNLKKK